MNIAQTIENIFKAKGLQQKQFCDQIDVSESAFIGWKKAKNENFPADKILAAAQCLNVSVYDILGYDNELKKKAHSITEKAEKMVAIDNLHRVFLENYSNIAGDHYYTFLESHGFSEAQLTSLFLGKRVPTNEELSDMIQKFNYTKEAISLNRGLPEIDSTHAILKENWNDIKPIQDTGKSMTK